MKRLNRKTPYQDGIHPSNKILLKGNISTRRWLMEKKEDFSARLYSLQQQGAPEGRHPGKTRPATRAHSSNRIALKRRGFGKTTLTPAIRHSSKEYRWVI
jgi:hypothetical protein